MVTVFLSNNIVHVTCIVISVAVAIGERSCGSDLIIATHIPGYITSPGFPTSGYERNITCEWNISVTDQVNTLKLQAVITNLNSRRYKTCEGVDHVEIFYGLKKGIYCRNQSPTYYINSYSTPVKVTFRSIFRGSPGMGFKLKYYEGKFIHKVFPTVTARTESEEKTISLRNIDLGDKEFRSVTMSWTIRSSKLDEKIYFRFLSNRLFGLKCSTLTNYVDVFDGLDYNGKSLGRWCGGDTRRRYGSGQFLYIYLYVENYNKEYDFMIGYGNEPYEQPKPDPESSNSPGVALIAGVSVGVIAAVGVIYLATKIICTHCKDMEDEGPNNIDLEENISRQGLIHETPVSRVSPTAPPVSSDKDLRVPPPSYEEVMALT